MIPEVLEHARNANTPKDLIARAPYRPLGDEVQLEVYKSESGLRFLSAPESQTDRALKSLNIQGPVVSTHHVAIIDVMICELHLNLASLYGIRAILAATPATAAETPDQLRQDLAALETKGG